MLSDVRNVIYSLEVYALAIESISEDRLSIIERKNSSFNVFYSR